MKFKRTNMLMVFGTRPEVIKMAPLVHEFAKFPKHFNCRVCVTGQHRQMIDPLLKFFGIRVHDDLKIMQKNQGLEHITSMVMAQVSKLVRDLKIDWVIVQGDTTTAMAASLAAFYQKVKIAHVEAGLRTGDKFHPFPEEVNRRIIDNVSDLHFAHTPLARRNLLAEKVPSSSIEVTGNTVIDALFAAGRKKLVIKDRSLQRLEGEKRKIILTTIHRRENFGAPIVDICRALKTVAGRFSQEAVFVYPVHLNPNIQGPVYSLLKGLENVILLEPLEYPSFVYLMKKSYFVLTDSGGLQEEAPSLGKPVLVLRQTTERPEAVEAGCVKVIGTQTGKVIKNIEELLTNRKAYLRMARVKNPYGDGTASRRIVRRLLKEVC